MQLSTKLLDVWSCEHATITEIRILLVLGANPAKLYEDEHGARMLEERMLSGTLCPNCAALFQEFLDKALAIHEAQFEQVSFHFGAINTVSPVPQSLLIIDTADGARVLLSHRLKSH